MYIALMNGTKEQARTQGDWSQTVFFDTSGFDITGLVLFDAAEGGNPVEIFILPRTVQCPVGCIPVVRNGHLIIAKPVSMAAEITDKVDASVIGGR